MEICPCASAPAPPVAAPSLLFLESLSDPSCPHRPSTQTCFEIGQGGRFASCASSSSATSRSTVAAFLGVLVRPSLGRTGRQPKLAPRSAQGGRPTTPLRAFPDAAAPLDWRPRVRPDAASSRDLVSPRGAALLLARRRGRGDSSAKDTGSSNGSIPPPAAAARHLHSMRWHPPSSSSLGSRHPEHPQPWPQQINAANASAATPAADAAAAAAPDVTDAAPLASVAPAPATALAAAPAAASCGLHGRSEETDPLLPDPPLQTKLFQIRPCQTRPCRISLARSALRTLGLRR